MAELTKKIGLITVTKEKSMKKFVVFCTLICMLSLLAVSAFADEAALITPFDNDAFKVNVLETFDDTKAIKNVYLGTPDGPIAITEKGFTDYYSFSRGKFAVKEGAAGTSCVGVVDDNLKALAFISRTRAKKILNSLSILWTVKTVTETKIKAV